VTDIDEAGAKRCAEAIERSGGKAVAIHHDVTNEVAWRHVIETVESRLGRLDALVNNAGVMITRPFKLTTLDEYKNQQLVNVESVWLGCQAAHDLLSKTAASFGDASIVNISSILGLKGGPMHSAYCASKGAVRLLSKALAVELGRQKIRVNSVHPGLVDTQLGIGAMAELVKYGAPAGSLEEVLKNSAARTPLGRFAVPDDVARVVAFLCSEESQFLTGGELIVDGGSTVA
jgi:cyclopentanol dehydrogenase